MGAPTETKFSKWVVDVVMNVIWSVWKIRDHPISRGKYLPGYISENRRNGCTGKQCKDRQTISTQAVFLTLPDPQQHEEFREIPSSTTNSTETLGKSERSTIDTVPHTV